MRKTIWLLMVLFLVMTAGCVSQTEQTIMPDEDDISEPTAEASETPTPEPEVTLPTPTPTAKASDKPEPTPKPEESVAGLTITLNNKPLTFTLGMTMDEAKTLLQNARIDYVLREDSSPRRSWSGFSLWVVDKAVLTFDMNDQRLHDIEMKDMQAQTDLGLCWDSGKHGMEQTLGTDYTSIEDTVFEYSRGGNFIEVTIITDQICSYNVSQYSSAQYRSANKAGCVQIANNTGDQADFYIGMTYTEAVDTLKRLKIDTDIRDYTTDNPWPEFKHMTHIEVKDKDVRLCFNRAKCDEIIVYEQPTPEGLKIGDSMERVRELYGEPVNEYCWTDRVYEYAYGDHYFFVNIKNADGRNPDEKPNVSWWGYSRYRHDKRWISALEQRVYSPNGRWMVIMPKNVPFLFDVDDDGVNEQITARLNKHTYDVKLRVTDGKDVKTEATRGFAYGLYYFVNPDGELAAMLSYDAASDDYVTIIYTFKGITPVEKSELLGLVTAVDTDSIAMFDYVFVLGTWRANAEYTINEDFITTPAGDGFWHIDPKEWEGRALTAAKEVPVKILKDGEYVEDTLKVGTKLWPTVTDRKSFVLFETEDGRKGRIEFERREGFLYIDGIEDGEMFRNIMYCG